MLTVHKKPFYFIKIFLLKIKKKQFPSKMSKKLNNKVFNPQPDYIFLFM